MGLGSAFARARRAGARNGDDEPGGGGLAETAAQAEARYRRMIELRRMDAADLRRLLAGDPARAAAYVDTAARFGVVEAQIRYGRMLLEGQGVARDEGAALQWLHRAARCGSAEAMNMVGRCFENGWGTPQDLAEAARWYRASGEAGCDWGEYNYANMLFDGRGVAEDRSGAVAWYRRAAGRGHTRAMNLLARCQEEGWGGARNAAEAFAWYRRSAEGGYFRAQFNYATLLAALGREEEALAWFEAACRAATPDSLRSMLDLLRGRPEPSLAGLGRRLEAELAAPGAGTTEMEP